MNILNPYEEEVQKKWGDTQAYKQSQERVAKMSPEEWANIAQEADELMKQIVANKSKGADSSEIQSLIKKHYENLKNFYEPNLEMYQGLAEMYVSDNRFGEYFDKYEKGLASFMKEAMLIFCEKSK